MLPGAIDGRLPEMRQRPLSHVPSAHTRVNREVYGYEDLLIFLYIRVSLRLVC